MTKILLVEDDKSLREIYGVRLLAEGYDIVSAGDGEEALAMAIKEKPELIISDVMMPKISGFDMLDILRSTTETRDIKVIMMTALSSDDQRARGEQLGADKYLVKSQVGIEDVVRTVHEVLGDAGKVVPTSSEGGDAPAADTPAPEASSDEAAPASEPPAESSTNTDNLQENNDMNPTDNTTPSPAADAPVEPVAPVAPVSDSSEAGPLPPQPTEVESTLPQPTAPFSSPAPTNLGEQVVHPDVAASDAAPAETVGLGSDATSSEQVNTEMTAPAEPVSTQVDAPELNSVSAPATDAVVPPVVDPLAPAAPAAPEVPSSSDDTTPPAAPAV